MISYTGTHITREFGALNITDMAVQGMRICRFAGAGYKIHFWPVGMHSLFVADILDVVLKRPDLEHEALIHDLEAEAIMCDIPKPHKTAEQKAHENVLAARTRFNLGLATLTDADAKIIKRADIIAVHAEGAAGCGPRGYVETQTGFELNQDAANLLHRYLSDSCFKFDEMLLPNGHWPTLFEDRLRAALRRAQNIESIRA